MEQDRAITLLIRQLKDIQAQADKILTGEDSDDAIENFSKYSAELKIYIRKNIEDKEVNSYLTELPEVKFTKTMILMWHNIFFPAAWYFIYKNYQAKMESIEEIKFVRGKYATLEFLIKDLPNQGNGSIIKSVTVEGKAVSKPQLLLAKHLT